MITILSIICVSLTFFVKKRMDAIRASVLCTIILSLCVYLLFPIKSDLYFYVLFGASFVGMTSKDVLNYRWIIWGSIIYSVFFQVLLKYLPQVGGQLGFMAFLSVCFTYLLKLILRKIAGS